MKSQQNGIELVTRHLETQPGGSGLRFPQHLCPFEGEVPGDELQHWEGHASARPTSSGTPLLQTGKMNEGQLLNQDRNPSKIRENHSKLY